MNDLINLPGVARNFPKKPNTEIKRDNIVLTMQDLLSSDIAVLAVEGEDGIGKTNLLSQFARLNNERTVSIFIEPSSKYAYDIGYLSQVISEQVSWIVNNEPLEASEYDESYLSRYMARLQRKAKKLGVLNFVIDGLTDIPNKSESQKKIILHELIPLGLPEFKFIISGNTEDLKKLLNDIPKTKSLPLSPFSLDETTKYLKESKSKGPEIQNIHKMCRGLPGHLEIVKRQIDTGTPIESFTSADPLNLPDFISIEWNRIKDQLSEEERKALVLIAISKKDFRREELESFGYLDSKNIDAFIKKIGIIECVDEYIKFISYPHRKFVLKELDSYKDEVTEAQIKKLLEDIESRTSVDELPDLLEDKGDLERLVDVLSPDYFKNALKYSKSLYYIYNRSQQGIESAKKTENLSDLFKYSLQKSILFELLQKSTTKEELEARLIVEDFDTALSLAQSAFTREEKLNQLCIVAKYYKKNDKALNQEIVDQIKLLVEQVDDNFFSDKGVDIASNLIWVDPDLAIEIVEKTLDFKDDENNLDFAFTKLSLEASEAKGNEPLYADVLEKTKSKISDPNLQSFIEAASSFTGDLSSSEITEIIDPLETKTKVFILRQWLLKNSYPKDVDKVIKYTLDQLVSSAKYTPKIRDLREIISPLDLVENKSVKEELINRVDSLVSTMRNLGTSVEYVRLQLILARNEVSINKVSSSINRSIDIYFYIDRIQDLITKTECFAWFYSMSDDINPEDKLELEEGLITLIKESLSKGLEEVLKFSASQYVSCKGIFKALSTNKLEVVLEEAEKLNIQMSRDNAFSDILINVSKGKKEFDLSVFQQTIKKINNLKLKDSTILKITKNLSNQNNFNRTQIYGLKSIIELVSNNENKLLCYANYLNLLENNEDGEEYNELKESINEKIDEHWQQIDSTWIKVNIGYNITKILSKTSKTTGLDFIDKVDRINKGKGIDSPKSALIFISSIRLATRLASGVIKKSNDSDYSLLKRIAQLIEKIPSGSERSGIWTDFALRCYALDERKTANKIVKEYLLPTIEGISDLTGSYRSSIICNSAPAIYLYHNNTMSNLLKDLNSEYKEYAIDNICTFLLRKTSLDDPYRGGPEEKYRLNHEEALDIISLIEHFETDVYVYRYVDDLVISISDKKNKLSFTNQQKRDLAFKLEEIINEKLPDGKNIRHEGFKIASLATLNNLRNVDRSKWESLIDEAKSIKNESDKAFVLGIIARNLNENKFRKIYASLLNDIDEIIQKNTNTIERMNRYYDVANLLVSKDQSSFKRNLQKSLKSCVNSERDDVAADKQKSIIDLAHSIDQHFASSLISLLDDDEARKKDRDSIAERVKFLDLKKEMGDRKVLDLELDDSDYAEAAWLNLGALNAEKLETFHMENFYDHLEKSSKLGINYSFAVLSWIVENATRRFSDTDDMNSVLMDLFEASMICCDLAYYFDTVNKNSISNIRSHRSQADTKDSIIQIKEGEREKAKDFIKNWIKEHVGSYIKICDPFFNPEELWVVKLIKEEAPDCQISILSGKKQLQTSNYSKEFRDYWNFNISESDPPFVKYVIVSIGKSEETPIHDRWIITEESGLKLGTSINSLGLRKVSEISLMESDEYEEKQSIVDEYLNMERFRHQSEKLVYDVFNL